MTQSLPYYLCRDSHKFGDCGPGMAVVIGAKFSFYFRILCNDLKAFGHFPSLGFVFLKMIGTAVMVRGK